MREITIKPTQIMTTNDFPVHNEQILKIYFKIAKHNPELLPPTPVFHMSLGLPLLKEDNDFSIQHNQSIRDYFEENPDVEYIMWDGSHKTTALTLTHNPINAVRIETDDELSEFKKLEETGEIFSFACLGSLEEMMEDKAKHFSEAELFQTVQSKTDRMVDAKVIPDYMISWYQNSTAI